MDENRLLSVADLPRLAKTFFFESTIIDIHPIGQKTHNNKFMRVTQTKNIAKTKDPRTKENYVNNTHHPEVQSLHIIT